MAFYLLLYIVSYIRENMTIVSVPFVHGYRRGRRDDGACSPGCITWNVQEVLSDIAWLKCDANLLCMEWTM